LLQQACAALGSPLTVQDSTFRQSFLWYLEWQNVFWPLINLGGIMPMLVVLILFPHVELDLIFPLLILWFPLLLYLLMRNAYVHLRASNAKVKMAKLFHKIRHAKGLLSGVLIVRCDDSFWRDVVKDSLDMADVAIIDVTELTKNVIWEMRRAIESPGASCMVVACAVESEFDRDLPAETASELEILLGEELHKVQVFLYPKFHGRLGFLRFGLYKSLAKELSKCIAFCLVQRDPCNAFFALQE
jgi:hypothetical protein